MRIYLALFFAVDNELVSLCLYGDGVGRLSRSSLWQLMKSHGFLPLMDAHYRAREKERERERRSQTFFLFHSNGWARRGRGMAFLALVAIKRLALPWPDPGNG